MELLASEGAVDPSRMQDYWALSSDLIVLVTDIEEYERVAPNASYDDPTLFSFKQRIRAIAARLGQMSGETG